jgi:pimeloyl-ACP methyl ester carboxylesterase
MQARMQVQHGRRQHQAPDQPAALIDTGMHLVAVVGARSPLARGQRRTLFELRKAEDRLHMISAPTLIVHGDSDRVVPPANARVLGQLIPNAEVLILEGSGHACSFDQRDRFNEAVLGFLTARRESVAWSASVVRWG